MKNGGSQNGPDYYTKGPHQMTVCGPLNPINQPDRY